MSHTSPFKEVCLFNIFCNLFVGFRIAEFNHVKITEKWGEIQRKLDLVRVSGEFEFIGVLLYIRAFNRGKNCFHLNQPYSYVLADP